MGIECLSDRGLDDEKVRCDIKVPWGEQRMMPDVETFFVTLHTCRVWRLFEYEVRQNRIVNGLKGLQSCRWIVIRDPFILLLDDVVR